MAQSRPLSTMLSVETREGPNTSTITACVTYGGLQFAVMQAISYIHQTWESGRMIALLDRVTQHASVSPDDMLCISFSDDGWEELDQLRQCGTNEYQILVFATQIAKEP